VADSLAEEAQTEGADLLVVGTHQPHGFERIKTGSAAITALHVAHTPVLCVPGGLRSAEPLPSTASIPSLRSVLVATDFSPLGDAAVPHAYALLRGAGGTVELCHVHERALPSPAYVLPDRGARISDGERRELERKLRDLEPRQAAELGITTKVTVIDGGSAAEEILRAARRLGVDAIVVASHGRSGIGRALLGSVAEAVLRGSERPVHVVRGPR
jgi:nucleotide-binding universal stress UspA family protein